MGQAKRRGDFNQRKTQSINNAETLRQKREAEYIEREKHKTPQQRAAEAKAQMKLATILAMTAGLSKFKM